MIYVRSILVAGIAFDFQVSCSLWLSCKSLQELTHHALYMRLKRLCSRNTQGRCNVPEDIEQQFLSGNRDELLLALTKSLKIHGFFSDTNTRKLVKVGPVFKQYSFKL